MENLMNMANEANKFSGSLYLLITGKRQTNIDNGCNLARSWCDQRDFAGKLDGFFDRMRDKHYGRSREHPEPLKIGADMLAGHSIEFAERFIKKHNFGVMHHRLTKSRALLHAARQLERIPVCEIFKCHRFQ